VLTVVPDTNSPTLVSVQNDGSNLLAVLLSEPLEPTSATNRVNYALNQGVTVTAVTLAPDGRTVNLTVTPLAFGLPHILTVNQVRDRAAAGNVIALNSQLVFTPGEYRPLDIGSPPQTTMVALTTNGQTITAGGRDIGGAADQFHFSFQARSGNFDVRVRLAALSASDAWAKAGLMARETLTPDSRFVAALATRASADRSSSAAAASAPRRCPRDSSRSTTRTRGCVYSEWEMFSPATEASTTNVGHRSVR